MSKRRRRPTQEEKKAPRDKRVIYKNILRLLILVALTLAVYLVYNVFVEMYFYPIMISYTLICTVAVFAYVIYNRGFSRRGITPEMLPDTMTAEQKQEFIEDGQRRLKKSRPLLMVVFAFAFTFIMDIISLFALPFLSNIFS